MSIPELLLVVIIVFCVSVFLLSVIAPSGEKRLRPFWRAINRMRDGMDFVCYWFFNLCAAAALIYGVWWGIRHAFGG